MNKIQYITKEKRKELEEELEYLKTQKRMEIAEALETARGFGDLRENAEYQEAREAQANTEARIQELEELLSNAKTLSKSKSSNEVSVGSVVLLEKPGTSEKLSYEIVGASEADISAHKISNESPLGMALLGKKKGESFELETPSGKIKYKVLEIK